MATALLQQLLDDYVTGNLQPEDRQRLLELLQDPATAAKADAIILQQLETGLYDADDNKDLRLRLQKRLDAQIQQQQASQTTSRIRLHTTNWFRYTAAILILAIGSGIYYFNTQSYKSQKSNKSQFRQKAQATIPPGSNKAIWILTNGKQIELDSSILDMTAKQTASNNAGYNELRTPRGGQYQLILPDGSKVWLNAASSIKYPVVFEGKERRVEVTGEAYFEIEKDADKPFKVHGAGQEIEVLGTSFNINVYNDEPIQKTTLITGSIKITHNNQTAILKPGQQVNISITPITKIKQITVQTNNTIAWKNGQISIEDADFPQLARQLERWYDIRIIYESNIPVITFKGEINRNANLSDVVQFLTGVGIQCRIEGRSLIVH